jgi:hypothetical protein
MSKSIEPFRRAILESLSKLVESGDLITNKTVIDNAKFDAGNSVGKSTLYRKNDDTKEFVHKSLLNAIQEAKDGIDIANDKPIKAQKINKLTEDKNKLKSRIDDIADKILEQEVKLKNAQSGIDSDKHVTKSLELEMYVVLSILITNTPRLSLINKRAQDFINKYEQKTNNPDTIKRAKVEVSEYISDIKYSTITTLT